LNAVRVIVTRPERDARRWVQNLQQHGLQAEALPLIDIAALPDSQRLQQAWGEIDAYAALMFVSGNAVNCFFALKPSPAHADRAQEAIDIMVNQALAAATAPRSRAEADRVSS